jgi:hypothetical protein
MNAMTIILLILTATALTALTWWGCTWWYGRKLAEIQGRLEKTRQTAAQSTAQMRRQIGQLQKELAERPAAATPQRKVRDEAAEAAEAAAAAAARRQALEESLDTPVRRPSSGFADTQPMA